MEHSSTTSTPNPFSTRFIRPGACEFVPTADELSVEALMTRLSRRGSGEIVGPHGTGKTTLALAIADAFRGRGLKAHFTQLRPGHTYVETPAASAGDLWVVDGFEQLGWWRRWTVRRTARRRGLQLLVTTHEAAGFPLLHATSPTFDAAQRIVDRLLDGDWTVISREDLRDCFEKHRIESANSPPIADLREMLFSLYDRYESRSRVGPTPAN